MHKKRIGISQKIIYHSEFNEINLSLDIEWINLLNTLKALALPLPLVKFNEVKFLIKELKLDGIILSGGGDLFEYCFGNTQKKKLCKWRDDFELEVI